MLVQSDKLIPSAPPFSFTQQDVGKLFGKGFTIKQLSRENIFDSDPRWKTKGLKVCWMGGTSCLDGTCMNAYMTELMLG